MCFELCRFDFDTGQQDYCVTCHGRFTWCCCDSQLRNPFYIDVVLCAENEMLVPKGVELS